MGPVCDARGMSRQCYINKEGQSCLSLASSLHFTGCLLCPGMLGAEEAAISRERRVQTSEGSWTRKPLYQVFQNEGFQGQECGSSVHKVLGLTLGTAKPNNNTHFNTKNKTKTSRLKHQELYPESNVGSEDGH